MDMQREPVSLNGQWEAVRGHADAEVFRSEVAAGIEGWQAVTIPGSLVPGLDKKAREVVDIVWARKTSVLTGEQASRNAVLKWNSVRYGATAWLNGQQVTQYAPMGPHTVLLPKGLLHEGTNQLVLKVPGWAGLPKSKSGFPLIPTGSGTQSWGRKDACIPDDIWVEFYDRAYMKWVLAEPDIKAGKVTFRIWFDSIEPLPQELAVVAQVLGQGDSKPTGQKKAAIKPGKSPVEVAVAVKDMQLWRPEKPYLYTADIVAEGADHVRFTFGMRMIEVAKGHFQLNGERLWLHGSNLVSEWLWGDRDNEYNKNIKTYIVDEARAMSLNSFRTHTLPPPTSWLDVADQYGTMILAEFPVLYNFKDFQFTPAEYDIFHRNVLLDATGWTTKLWNHPSVIVWVISNETRDDHAWEMGPYRNHVKALDPTRPVLRSGQDTAECHDTHTCGNLARHSEGEYIQRFTEEAGKRDGQRTLSNTEYMNYLASKDEIHTRLLGSPKHPYAELMFAEYAMEHTEAMRRLDYDLILPYLYAGWTRLRAKSLWREDYPTPIAAALHSCMSPVLASADLFDRNYTVGQEVTTRLALINDTPADVKTKVDVYVTPQDPVFVPDQKALASALSRQTIEVTFKGRKTTDKTIRWRVPAKEGNYFLAVVTTIPGGKPVVSQRVVRAIDPGISNKDLKTNRVVALAMPNSMARWLKERRIPLATSIASGRVDGDIVVIGPCRDVPGADKRQTKALLEFVRNGGRVVVLAQEEWDWKDLVDFEMDKTRSSRAFACPEAGHSLLAGIDGEYLKRWNGLPGQIAGAVIKGPILERATKLVWMEEPAMPICISVAEGKGEIVICLLQFDGRLGQGAPSRDPVVERVALNLLQR